MPVAYPEVIGYAREVRRRRRSAAGRPAACWRRGSARTRGARVCLVEAGRTTARTTTAAGRPTSSTGAGSRSTRTAGSATTTRTAPSSARAILGGCSAHNACVLLRAAPTPTTTSGDRAGRRPSSSPTSTAPSGVRDAPFDAERAVAVARGVRRGRRRRRDRRIRVNMTAARRPLERRVRVARPGARPRQPDDPRPTRSSTACCSTATRAVGVATVGGRARGRHGRARGERVRLARRPAAQRDRPGVGPARSARASSTTSGPAWAGSRPTSCARDWDALRGDARARSCGVTVADAQRDCSEGICDLFLFPARRSPGYEISGAVFAMKPRSRGRVHADAPTTRGRRS